MSLKDQVDSDIKKAMLAKNKDELRALRGIKSLILLAETQKGSSHELDQAAEMQLLTKAVKQRKESFDIYISQGRDDLATIEKQEIDVINRYLPKQLSEEDLASEMNKIIAQVGAKSIQDLGKVMGVAAKALAGKADGKTISESARKILNSMPDD
jgi:hypothetical protein